MRYSGAQGHVQGAVQGVVGRHIKGDGLQDVAAAWASCTFKCRWFITGSPDIAPPGRRLPGRVAGAKRLRVSRWRWKRVQIVELHLGVDFEGGPGRLRPTCSWKACSNRSCKAPTGLAAARSPPRPHAPILWSAGYRRATP